MSGVSRSASVILLVLGTIACAACGDNGAAKGINGPCTRNSDCESGLSCIAGLCEPPDGGGPTEGGDSSHPTDGSSSG